jgi:hypothetical protein
VVGRESSADLAASLQDDDEPSTRAHDVSPRLEEVRDRFWICGIDLDAIGEQRLWQRFRRYACGGIDLVSEMTFDGVVRAWRGEIVRVAGRTASAGAHGAALYGARQHAIYCVIVAHVFEVSRLEHSLRVASATRSSHAGDRSVSSGALTSLRHRASVLFVEPMSIVAASTRATRRQGAGGHVCAHRDCARMANFAGKGTVEGIKRQPRPTTYEGKAPDA